MNYTFDKRGCGYPREGLYITSTDGIPTTWSGNDFLMWVGKVYYKTIASFVEEAEKMGVQKRIANIPRGLVLNSSRIFLAHPGTKIPPETGITGVVFGFFIVSGIRWFVREKQYARAMLNWALEHGVTEIAIPTDGEAKDIDQVELSQVIAEKDLIATKLDYREPGKEKPVWWRPDRQVKPIKARLLQEIKPFRGYMRINGNAILNGRPEAEWKAEYDAEADRKGRQLALELGAK